MTEHSALPFIKFIFFLFKSLGVGTVGIDSDFHFLLSKLGIAYNVLLIILVLASSYFAVHLSYFQDFAGRGQLEKVTDTIQTVFVIVTALFILIVHCIRQEQIIKIANNLRQLILVSSALCCTPTYEQKSRDAMRALKIIILFNATVASIYLIATPTITFDFFVYFVSVTVCYFIVNTLIMQYTIVLTVIGHLFDMLNTSLVEITHCSIEHLNISFIQKYGSQLKLKKLTDCRDFFTSLSKLSKEISKFMETIMLACIANVFLTLIIYGYYIMKPIIVGKNVIDTSIWIRCSTQLIFSIVSTVLLVNAGSTAVNQSKWTGEIVNEALHKEGFICHPDVAKLLNRFSSYLLHTNVRFGVYNLFTFDESLLMSISGSITTYLVILLQFKQGQTA